MVGAPRITLNASPEARARYLAGVYADSVTDLEALGELLARLPGRHGRKTLAAWRALAEAGELETLAAALIEAHYDPAYGRVAKLDMRPRLDVIELADLSEADQERAADRITEIVDIT